MSLNKLSLLYESWFQLQDKLFDDGFLEENDSPGEKSYDNSLISEAGGEAFLRCNFYSIINDFLEKYDFEYVQFVESDTYKINSPDIILRKSEPEYFHTEAIISLNIIDADWFSHDGRAKLKEELNKHYQEYSDREDDISVFLGCFYESDPNEIKSKIEAEGSILNWIVENQNYEIDDDFAQNIYEGYGYRNHQNWDFIKSRGCLEESEKTIVTKYKLIEDDGIWFITSNTCQKYSDFKSEKEATDKLLDLVSENRPATSKVERENR